MRSRFDHPSAGLRSLSVSKKLSRGAAAPPGNREDSFGIISPPVRDEAPHRDEGSFAPPDIEALRYPDAQILLSKSRNLLASSLLTVKKNVTGWTAPPGTMTWKLPVRVTVVQSRGLNRISERQERGIRRSGEAVPTSDEEEDGGTE